MVVGAGAADIVKKPIDTEELLRKIEQSAPGKTPRLRVPEKIRGFVDADTSLVYFRALRNRRNEIRSPSLGFHFPAVTSLRNLVRSRTSSATEPVLHRLRLACFGRVRNANKGVGVMLC